MWYNDGMSVDLFHDPIIRVGQGAGRKRRMRLWWRFADGTETKPRVVTWPDDFVGAMTDDEIDDMMLELGPRLGRKLDDVDRKVRERPARPAGGRPT